MDEGGRKIRGSGQHDGAGFGKSGHIAQVNQREGRFPHDQHQAAALLSITSAARSIKLCEMPQAMRPRVPTEQGTTAIAS